MAYQRKDTKTWVATWTDKQGKSHRKSGFSSRKHAELFEARQKLLLETNLVYGVSFQRDLTIKEAIERYLWQLNLRVKASSVKTNKAFLVSIQQFFDQEKIELYESVTPQIMREYIQFRRDCGISDVTINNSLQVFCGVCKLMKESGIAPNNPLENFKKIRVDKQDDVRILSKKELAVIEKIAESSSRRDEFFFLVRTGCRVSEMINLEVDDVDFKKKRVKISASKAKSRRTRYVPITQSVIDILRRKVEAANERGCTIVFPNNRGKKLFVVGVWKSFSCILQKAKSEGVNVDGVKVHTLRATYISHMIMNGVDPMKVMRIVGHTNFETMKKYLHLSDEYLNDVPEIF